MRLFFLYCLVVLISVSWLSTGSRAATAETDIQKLYGEMFSFAADFEQTISHRESGLIEKRRGKLLFKKPLLVRWQTSKPHEELLLVNADAVWNYLPDEEVVYRYPLEVMQGSQGIIQVLTGQAALTKDFEVKAEGKEKTLCKLRLYPKEPSPQMVEALIWVDGKGYIRRASILDFYGNSNDVRFTRFITDTVRDIDFLFVPPKGVDIEDRSSQDGGRFFN
ncbi:MAG: outer membrane lipoprotein chaperone LolA [Desulfovibrio sp.]|nr:outer membrane lipoprotein chaperone LolA [Desulfovibrio sp.]